MVGTKQEGINLLGQRKPDDKQDQDKPMVGLLLRSFPHALMAVSERLSFGAKKGYTPDGWSEREAGHARYTDALGRHLLQELSGEVVDEDSGQGHDVAVAWNALARLELRLRGKV